MILRSPTRRTAFLPDGDPITNGTYKPTDYRPGDSLPSPAPSGPYSPVLSVFRGVDPNGPWKLYAFDDALGDGGGISAWSLNFDWAVAPVLVNPRWTNGVFQADVLGSPGIPYVIERSTNFTAWLPLLTNVFTTNLNTFADPQSSQLPIRFYRAVQ